MDDEILGRAHGLFSDFLDLDDEGRETTLDDLTERDPATAAALRALLDAHRVDDGPFDRLQRAIGVGREAAAPVDAPNPEYGERWIRIRELGRGGTGVVDLAEDARLGRRVAIKTLRPTLAASPWARERLLGEARTIAALEHPNIIPIHEVGVDEEGGVVLVLGYSDGRSLKEVLSGGRCLDLDTAIPIAAGIARGLAAAHARGVVHRDVKPSNVLVGDDGVARLTDFGIARSASPGGAGTSAAVGTPVYMSPEARAGEASDPRFDVWALGVVLHEMLHGHPPEFRDGAYVPMGDRSSSDARWGRIDALLGRMLAPEVRGRPADALAVVKVLEELERAPESPPAGRGWRVGWVGGFIVLVVAVAMLGRSGSTPPVLDAPVANRGHVLWVDDDPSMSADEETVLAQSGVRVTRVASTEEALAVFDPGEHDVVVSDMGRTDGAGFREDAGLELLRRLRSRAPDAPFVFFTSRYAAETMGAEVAASGAIGITASSTEFYRLIAQALDEALPANR